MNSFQSLKLVCVTSVTFVSRDMKCHPTYILRLAFEYSDMTSHRSTRSWLKLLAPMLALKLLAPLLAVGVRNDGVPFRGDRVAGFGGGGVGARFE